MRERLGRHCDQEYRRDRLSLHYSLWDSGNIVGESFVTLSNFKALSRLGIPSLTPEEYALLLNLEETFMACVLQTLRSVDLTWFLDDDVLKPWPGMYLNAVLPLFQGFINGDYGEPAKRETFADTLHSPTSDIQEWVKRCRDSFNDLRDSPDSQLREYWLDSLEKARKLAAALKKPRKDIVMYHAGKQKLQMFREIRNSGALLKARKLRGCSLFFSWG